jgi:hypothetical protein
MAMSDPDLDAEMRRLMSEELAMDSLQDDGIHISPLLTDEGARLWPTLLREAIDHQSIKWLAASLRACGLIRTHIARPIPDGGFDTICIPDAAADMLAEGEFNHYYARGLRAAALAARQRIYNLITPPEAEETSPAPVVRFVAQRAVN